MELNEQARAYLELHPQAPDPDWGTDVGQWRQENDEEYRVGREAFLAAHGEPEQVSAVEEFSIDDVPVRLYRPTGGEGAVLVWLHGGAWIGGDPEGYDVLLRALANRVGCAVLNVDYRLAPEHRFPAGIDDCWTATVWAAANFDRVAVGGDSAGGTLSIGVALRAREANRPRIAIQVLVYPSTSGDKFLSEGGLSWIGKAYLSDPSQAEDPLVAPLTEPDLTRLPPAFVLTARCDDLHSEGQEFAAKLAAAGVPVELVDYAGQFHGFFHLTGVLDDADDALERVSGALRRAFRIIVDDGAQPSQG